MALTNTGRDYLNGSIIANPTALFNVTNAHIGVGDSVVAFAATQTDLQAATNKLRKIVDIAPTNPTANSTEFLSTFGTAEANFAWEEWAVFNAATGGIMLNRKVEALGTKTSAQSWEITVTLTLNNP